jgi:hypothetical protein
MARHRSRRVRRSGSATAAAAAVTLLAAAALFLVARNAGEAMERLLPPAEVVALKLATAEAKRPDVKLSAQSLEAARRAIVAEPLAYEPFFVAARAAEQAGRFEEATRLMEEVRRRRPSFSPARLHLMGYYGRSGRHRDALLEADVAMRLSPEAQKHIVPLLADMLPYREAREGLARSLAANPAWRADFVDTAKKKARPEDAAALLQEVRRLRPPHGTALEAGLLVETLVRVGRYAEARRAWTGLLSAADRGRLGLVFDGEFAGSAAPGPFNWSFPSTPVGRAEIARAAGREPAQLSLSHFGGAPADLAEQVLVLTPGRYVLTLDAKADRPEISGEVFWRVGCLGSATELGILRLQKFGANFARHQLAFTVPAGCAAQKLAVGASPGDLAQPVNVSFARLKVTRGG